MQIALPQELYQLMSPLTMCPTTHLFLFAFINIEYFQFFLFLLI